MTNPTAPAAPAPPAPAAQEEECLYYVGLREDAPMDVVNIPTKPGYKSVSVPRWTKELHESAKDPNQLELGGPIRGRHEALLPIEVKHFMEYVRSHVFFIKSVVEQDLGPKGKRIVKVGYVESLNAVREGIRSPRDVAKKTEPLARYIWIVPATDRSRYPGVPPTIEEMDEKGGA